MVHLSLSFAGIDRVEGTVEEADAQHRLLIQLGQAATIGQFKGDREPIFQEIREAIAEFRERFFLPSRARRLALLGAHRAGTLSDEDLPRDILTILLMHDAELAMPDELMVREVAFFYLAASHTSVHTLVHATNELFHWCEREGATPEKIVADAHQLQRFVLESMRLHPQAPRPGVAQKQKSRLLVVRSCPRVTRWSSIYRRRIAIQPYLAPMPPNSIRYAVFKGGSVRQECHLAAACTSVLV